jgi:hypothetical protein
MNSRIETLVGTTVSYSGKERHGSPVALLGRSLVFLRPVGGLFDVVTAMAIKSLMFLDVRPRHSSIG